MLKRFMSAAALSTLIALPALAGPAAPANAPEL